MNKRTSTLRGALRPLALAAALGAMTLSLSGCIGLAMGGAVVGTMAATDRRTLRYLLLLEDKIIRQPDARYEAQYDLGDR